MVSFKSLSATRGLVAMAMAMGCSFIDPTLDCYSVVKAMASLKAKWMEMDDYGETLMNIHAGLCTYAGQWWSLRRPVPLPVHLENYFTH